MISEKYFSFLKELKKNNEKIWFAKNKPRYDEIRLDFETVVSEIITAMAVSEPELKNLSPKDCVFRIYKDIRFSKDKTPYKTNMGAHIVRGGRKSGMAGYYIHIEPGNCFIGGGMYMPPAPILKQIRNEIHYNLESFEKIITDKDFKKFFKEITGSRTTVMPRGFEKTDKAAEYLKFKDYTVIYPVKDDFYLNKSAIKNIIELFKAMKPLNDFLNKSFE